MTSSALKDDADLPVCTACATQYPAPRDDCPICEDPRQFVPAAGQTWTTLGKLQDREQEVVPDADDPRLSLIVSNPGFAINQTRGCRAFLVQTPAGSYIWDCCGVITPSLVGYLATLKHPLKAMAISHPHFFSTSLTWCRALGITLYVNGADKEWYQRLSDIKRTDDVRWWRGKEEIGKGVTLIECGGHFPGSCVFHWDRASDPGPGPTTGILLTADTVMVQPTQKGFTFLWSYPNMIPLNPKDVLGIQRALADVDYDLVSSTWPDRMVRTGAKEVFEGSVERFLTQTGWKAQGDQLVPVESAALSL